MSEPRQLFELRAQKPHLGAPGALAVATHVVLVAVALQVSGERDERPAPKQAEYAEITFKTLPKRKPLPKLESGGSGQENGQPDAKAQRHELRAPQAMPPPPTVEPVLGDIQSVERFATPIDEPDSDAEDNDGVEDQAPALGSGGLGNGSGFGSGAASGSGFGRGAMTPHSKARRAWFITNNWRCERPDHQEEAGRVVVRVRVTVQADGRASKVAVVRPGLEIFDLRAMECASVEDYVTALDDDGNPLVGVAEFAIQFLK